MASDLPASGVESHGTPPSFPPNHSHPTSQHWAALKDLVFPRDNPPSLKEMNHRPKEHECERRSRSGPSYCGNDPQSGCSFLKHLYFLVCTIWVTESIPYSFLIDDIIPLFKRDERSNPKNYRPISLASVLAKLLQKLVYDIIKDWDETLPHGGISTECQYGGRKRRCRLLLVWTINAASYTLLQEKSPHYIVVGDIDNAFPSADRTSIDFLLRKQGLAGRLWRLARYLKLGLRSRLNINGHRSKPFPQKGGINQGAVPSPTEWTTLTAPLHRQAEQDGMGINIQNRFLPPLGFMDDITTILPKHLLDAWYKWRGPTTAEWGLSFKIPKGSSPP